MLWCMCRLYGLHGTFFVEAGEWSTQDFLVCIVTQQLETHGWNGKQITG